MTRIKVKKIIWEKQNIEHIKKHSVTKEEVEIISQNFKYHEKTYGGRYLVVGRSGVRIISIIVRRLGTGTYYVVTARDSDRRERRKLYDKEN